MKNAARIGLVALLAISRPAWGQAPAADTGKTAATVINPGWLHKPTADEISVYWPKEARAKGIKEGQAMIRCQVAIDGKLEGCTVVSESPADVGFGKAAIDMTGVMWMTPKMVDGQPVGGASVRVPINFKMPVITDPEWLRKPTPAEMAAYWPAEATSKGIKEGRVMVSCQVMADGKLDLCIVISESPVGFGFGNAAIYMTQLMLMKPKMVNGKPQGGGKVSIPITFSPSPTAPQPATQVITNPDWLRKPTQREMELA